MVRTVNCPPESGGQHIARRASGAQWRVVPEHSVEWNHPGALLLFIDGCAHCLMFRAIALTLRARLHSHPLMTAFGRGTPPDSAGEFGTAIFKLTHDRRLQAAGRRRSEAFLMVLECGIPWLMRACSVRNIAPCEGRRCLP